MARPSAYQADGAESIKTRRPVVMSALERWSLYRPGGPDGEGQAGGQARGRAASLIVITSRNLPLSLRLAELADFAN